MGHVLLNVRVTAPVALAAATVALAGCGSSQPAPRAAVAPELAATLFHDTRYEADGSALFRARRLLVRRCMDREGFAYHADDGAVPPPPDPRLPGVRDGYGLYAVVASIPASARRSPNADYVRGLAPARRADYERALNGPPDRVAKLAGAGLEYPTAGCYARAVKQVEGSLDAYYGRLAAQNDAAAAVNRSLHGDRPFVRALGGWKRCMRGRGYRLGSPGEARDVVYDNYLRSSDPARVRPRERATAAADRACALRTGFYDRQADARERALRALPPAQVRAVLALTRARAQAAARARAILRS